MTDLEVLDNIKQIETAFDNNLPFIAYKITYLLRQLLERDMEKMGKDILEKMK